MCIHSSLSNKNNAEKKKEGMPIYTRQNLTTSLTVTHKLGDNIINAIGIH